MFFTVIAPYDATPGCLFCLLYKHFTIITCLAMFNFTIPDILWFLLKTLSFIGIVFVGIILFNYFELQGTADKKSTKHDNDV
jgi:uncharacterized membrane protein